MKIFVKGNFFTYIDANNLVWIDNCENAIVYKNDTESSNYNILLKSSNTRFTDIPFASINDETNTPYATQAIFEDYIYQNTGVRFQQPLITLDDLDDVVVSAPSNGQVIEYNSTSGKWENVSPSALGGDMTQAVYDTDSDGVVDSSEKLEFIGKNSTGVTIGKTKVVYISGATGQKPNITLADASLEISSSKTIGITRNSIAHNTDGYVITHGTIHDINTSAFADGDALWLSETAGEIVNVVPNEPAHAVFIGFVAHAHPTNGKIILHIQNGYELNELHGVKITSEADKDIVYYNNSTGLWENATIPEVLGYTPSQNNSQFVFVHSKSNLPTASGGVITLASNVTYYFTNVVDLTGDRLVCNTNTTILGGSSENCRIKSTGLTGTALITSSYSLPIRNVTIEADIALNLSGDGTTTALDWFGVNFTDCNTVGTIANYTNFVMSDSAFLNAQGLTFDGTIGTIGISNSLFDCKASGTAITIASGANITRRFRIIYSSFVVLSGETALNVNASATIGDEKYILDTINFSGGGSYVAGVTHTSNKALFVNCVNITNTATRGFMYMVNNTTDTTIGSPNVNVWVKAGGTTTASADNSKFTHSANRLTYTGAFSNSFQIIVNCSVRSGSVSQVISIGVAKNGTILAESEMTVRTDVANQEYPASTSCQLSMTTNDYIEVFVKNTSSSNMRIADLNVSTIKIPV
jgi:hypothetical protein